MRSVWNLAQPEITDLIIQHDPRTLVRLPVRKQDVLRVFLGFHNHKALRAIEALPEREGILDDSVSPKSSTMATASGISCAAWSPRFATRDFAKRCASWMSGVAQVTLCAGSLPTYLWQMIRLS